MKTAKSKYDTDLSICTFLWGDWYSKGEEYLYKLKRGILRNLNQPHRFVCFTDRTQKIDFYSGIEFVPIPENVMKWRRNLKKLIMFIPFSGLTGRVLAFDLDVIVIGDLTEIAGYRGKFAVCESLRSNGRAGGSLISFSAGKLTNLYQKIRYNSNLQVLYKGSERKFYQGELGFVPDFWQRIFPGQVMNYRSQCGKGVPKGCRIVYFTGQPRPHQVSDQWVKDYWV